MDAFVNKPSFVFILLILFEIQLLNFTTYTDTQNICLQFEFDLLFTTSEKILDKIFGYDFSLIKPRKGTIFLNKILWKIAGKIVLDNLDCKIFYLSQPWWPTGFLDIYQLTTWNLKWLPKIFDHNDYQDSKFYFQHCK